MKYQILDTILDSHEAREIAEDYGFSSEEEGAEIYFNEIYYEGEWHIGMLPKYKKFIKTIEGGDLYYDYGANYYFLAKTKDINENINVKKKLIRITESDLHKIIKESVSSILSELKWPTYSNAAKSAYDRGDYDRAEKFANAATDNFNKEFGYEEDDNDLEYYGDKAKQDVGGKIYPNGSGQVGMGSYTSKVASMHGVKPMDKDYSYLNPNSKMKPSKNVIDKYNAANDEMDAFYDGRYNYENGKGWVKK